MTTNQTPTTPEAGWAEVENLVRATAWRFGDRYGGDRDELFGEAQVAFLKGHYHYHDVCPPHPYHTEIRRWVWFELFDAMRLRLEQRARTRVDVAGEAVYAAPDDDHARFARLACEVSDDAAFVLGLVFAPPEGLGADIRGRGGEGRNYRACIRNYLRRACRWSSRRINTAFDEIREEL